MASGNTFKLCLSFQNERKLLWQLKMEKTDSHLRQLLTDFKRHLSAAKYFWTITACRHFAFAAYTLLTKRSGCLQSDDQGRLVKDCLEAGGWGGEKEPHSWMETSNNSRSWSSLFPFSLPTLFSPPSLEHPNLPPLQCFEPWYDHSLDKHSSTMRGHKFFFLSSQTKLKKMPLVSGFWWELQVCFQFRVIPGTRRFLSKNRKVDGEEREGLGEEKKRRERRREGTLVNEHQMPYLRW